MSINEIFIQEKNVTKATLTQRHLVDFLKLGIKMQLFMLSSSTIDLSLHTAKRVYIQCIISRDWKKTTFYAYTVIIEFQMYISATHAA